MATNNAAWENLLAHTKVADLCVGKKELVMLASDLSMRDALKGLANNHITSAPVIDPHTKMFLGFIDVLDITGYVLAVWKEAANLRLWQSAHFPDSLFFDTSIKEVLNFSKVDPAVWISENATLSELLKLFKSPRAHMRLHRVAVVGEGGNKVVQVVSQSDLIAFAVANLGVYPKASVAVGELGVVHSAVTARLDTTFVDALQLLYRNKFSGLALVDHEYVLRGNLSASDLRGLQPTSFDFFNGSTLQFLVKGTKSLSTHVTVCDPGEPLGEVMKRMVAERVHRIYAVDSHGHLQGVVTMSDLLTIL